MKSKSKNKKPKLIYLIIGLILFLAGVQLVVTHCLANTGQRMRQLEKEADLLKRENSILTEEINKMGSLPRIATEASKMGLIKANNVLSLTPQVPVALEKNAINLER